MKNIEELKSIRVENLYKNFNGLGVLKGINLEIKKGEILSIFGPSGAGKTTLLHLIGLLDQPTRGNIYFNEHNISEFNDREMSRLRSQQIGFIFQFHHLLPEFTALENVLMPVLIIGHFSRKEASVRAQMLLEEVDLTARINHYPSELSGGERQRVALARALSADPSLILADEPTGNLDSLNGKMVFSLLKNLVASRRKTLLLVTHNEDLAKRADRTLRLTDGHLTPHP